MLNNRPDDKNNGIVPDPKPSIAMRPTMTRMPWSAIFLLGLVALCGAGALGSFFSEGIVWTSSCSLVTGFIRTVGYPDCRRFLFRHTGVAPAFVAIGDSLTERQEWRLNFPGLDIGNRGIGGATIRGADDTVRTMASAKNQTAIVLVGINDLIEPRVPLVNGAGLGRALLSYERLVGRLSQTFDHAVLQSVVFCNRRFERCGRHARLQIALLNRHIAALAQHYRFQYLDLNPVLAPTGMLTDQFTEDGVHFSAAGNREWAKVLKRALVRAPGLCPHCNAGVIGE